MTIHAMRVGVVEAPLLRPFTTALRTTSTIRSVVVRLDLDGAGGPHAWGATAPTPAITGDTEGAILTDLGRAASAVGGARIDTPDPADPAAALDALPAGTFTTASARAALDIALHDAAARAEGVALLDLLGGGRGAAVSDTTVSVAAPDVMAEEAADAVARGFDVLKVKLGAGAEQAGLDLDRLGAVRAAAPRATLRVDANQAWDVTGSIALITAIEDAGLDVELVEQPVARHDLAGLARVTAAVQTPILADEAVFTPADARRLLDERAADMINVKLLKSGGLRGARQILDLAADAGVACMVGAMMESTVGIAAALALACAHDAVTMIDLDPPLLTAAEPVRGGLAVDGATLRTLDAPGLGITDVEGVTWLD